MPMPFWSFKRAVAHGCALSKGLEVGLEGGKTWGRHREAVRQLCLLVSGPAPRAGGPPCAPAPKGEHP